MFGALLLLWRQEMSRGYQGSPLKRRARRVVRCLETVVVSAAAMTSRRAGGCAGGWSWFDCTQERTKGAFFRTEPRAASVQTGLDPHHQGPEPREATQETQETQKRLLISVDICRFLSISVISVVSWFPWFPWHRRRRRRAPLSAHTTRRPRYFAPRAAAHAHHTAPLFVVTRPNATCGRVAVGACAIKMARLEE